MSSQTFINLSGYRFVALDDPAGLRNAIKTGLDEIGVKGAVLLAPEGINVSLAGTLRQCDSARRFLQRYKPLSDIWFKVSESQFMPHARLKVRVRAEIIGFDDAPDNPITKDRSSAPGISPAMLNDWLNAGKDITLLDARNDYEVESGTFEGAVQLNIKHFRHFKKALRAAVASGVIDPQKPLVTFCTGGIRCEKAAPWLRDNGFADVYQVDGGVINYLECCGPSHWQGNCFVFDNRVELTAQLIPTGASLCEQCQLAVPEGRACDCHLGYHHHATY